MSSSRQLIDDLKYEMITQHSMDELFKFNQSIYDPKMHQQIEKEYEEMVENVIKYQSLLMVHDDMYYRIALEEIIDYIEKNGGEDYDKEQQ